MPWNPSDAKKHTKKANTPARQKHWADVANDALSGGATDGSAVRQANAAIRDGRKRG